MCHDRRWHDWELLRDEEQRQEEEPRLVEVAEPEAFEPEPEPERERELIRA
jgi:hypothetical protein